MCQYARYMRSYLFSLSIFVGYNKCFHPFDWRLCATFCRQHKRIFCDFVKCCKYLYEKCWHFSYYLSFYTAHFPEKLSLSLTHFSLFTHHISFYILLVYRCIHISCFAYICEQKGVFLLIFYY